MAVITDSIAERTAAAGVTVDGLLIKDGGLPDVTPADIGAEAAGSAAAAVAAHNTPAGHANGDGAIQFGSDVGTKRNFLFNLSEIPDVEAGVDEANHDLRGMYFHQLRSHFAAGRFNHYSTWGDKLAQYSARFGWSNEAIDPTGDGSNAKGQFMAGYGNVGWSPMSAALGMYNAASRTSYLVGQYNYAGVTPNAIQVHNWVDSVTPGSVEITGDLRTTYTAGKMVIIYGCSAGAGDVEFHYLNQVVSSTYSAPRTTINLLMPIDYRMATTAFMDSDGIWQSSYIVDAPTTPGNPRGAALGRYNDLRADSVAIGLDNLAIGKWGAAIGKQGIIKNQGEIATSGGFFIDGSSQRFAQGSKWYVKRKTAVTTATALTLDGAAPSTSTNQIVLNEGAAYRFRASITGILYTRADACAIDIEGLVFRNGSNTVAIVGQSTVVTYAGATMGTPTAGFVVDATNRAVQVTVTPGVNSVTIWNAEVSATIIGMDIPTGAT